MAFNFDINLAYNRKNTRRVSEIHSISLLVYLSFLRARAFKLPVNKEGTKAPTAAL